MIPNWTSLRAFASTTTLCLIVSWVLADTRDDAKQRQRQAMHAEQAQQEEQEAMRQFEKYECHAHCII